MFLIVKEQVKLAAKICFEFTKFYLKVIEKVWTWRLCEPTSIEISNKNYSFHYSENFHKKILSL